MLVCDELEIESWSPDFSSSGQRNPRWTRVSCQDNSLANSLEWIDWLENPVQVDLCTCCGTTGCDTGGYVHLSTLGNQVIWSAPQVGGLQDFDRERYQPSDVVRRQGAVLFPESTWERLRAVAVGPPAMHELPRATRRVLADCWRLSARGQAQVDSLEAVVPMLRERLLAAEHLQPAQAIGAIGSLVDWLSSDPDGVVNGTFLAPEEIEARIEVLYFDGPSEEDWAALAMEDGAPRLAFSRTLVFTPSA